MLDLLEKQTYFEKMDAPVTQTMLHEFERMPILLIEDDLRFFLTEQSFSYRFFLF